MCFGDSVQLQIVDDICIIKHNTSSEIYWYGNWICEFININIINRYDRINFSKFSSRPSLCQCSSWCMFHIVIFINVLFFVILNLDLHSTIERFSSRQLHWWLPIVGYLCNDRSQKWHFISIDYLIHNFSKRCVTEYRWQNVLEQKHKKHEHADWPSLFDGHWKKANDVYCVTQTKTMQDSKRNRK